MFLYPSHIWRPKQHQLYILTVQKRKKTHVRTSCGGKKATTCTQTRRIKGPPVQASRRKPSPAAFGATTFPNENTVDEQAPNNRTPTTTLQPSPFIRGRGGNEPRQNTKAATQQTSAEDRFLQKPTVIRPPPSRTPVPLSRLSRWSSFSKTRAGKH